METNACTNKNCDDCCAVLKSFCIEQQKREASKERVLKYSELLEDIIVSALGDKTHDEIRAFTGHNLAETERICTIRDLILKNLTK